MKKKGLGARLRAVFARGLPTEESFEDLEDLLLESDLGVQTTMALADAVREQSRTRKVRSDEDLVQILADELRGIVKAYQVVLDPERLNVILLLGVNGVGKTTTLAKLAAHFRETGQADGIVLAAGDTFRAAAVEQLEVHGQRLGIRVVSQGSGADPGAVIYDAVESARNRGDRLVLADTAGRMHTKNNLVAELGKIDRIVAGRVPDALYQRLLVVDATTGQNSLRQAETFAGAVDVAGIVLAKYDSTAKGGILVPISRDLGIPGSFVGTGERYEDLAVFDRDRYVNELLGIE